MTVTREFIIGATSLNFAAIGIVGLVAFASLSAQWETAETLGQHTEKWEQVGPQNAEFNKKLDTMTALLVDIRTQMAMSNSSARVRLQRAGVPIADDLDLVAVGDQPVVLPTTVAAKDRLIQNDLQPVQITPAIQGYVLDEATAAVVTQTIRDTPVLGDGDPKAIEDVSRFLTSPR